MSLRIASVLGAIALFAAACGGNGGGDDTATPTAGPGATFSRTLLTAVVLRPADVGTSFTTTGLDYNPVDTPTDSASFTVIYEDADLRIQSTAVRYPSLEQASREFTSLRRGIAALSNAREENYDVPGMESAFLYRIPNPKGLTGTAISGQVALYFQVAPKDVANPSPRAVDEAEFQRLAALMGERVAQLEADPASVTPIAESEFGGPTPAPSDATPAATP